MALSFGACAYSCSEGVCLSQAENVSKSSVRRKRRQSFGKDVKVTQGSSRQRKIRLFFLRFLFWLKFQINYNRSLCDVLKSWATCCWAISVSFSPPNASSNHFQVQFANIPAFERCFCHCKSCVQGQEHHHGNRKAACNSRVSTWNLNMKPFNSKICLENHRVEGAIVACSLSGLLQQQCQNLGKSGPTDPQCEHCRSSISTHWIAALATCHRKWKIWFHHV